MNNNVIAINSPQLLPAGTRYYMFDDLKTAQKDNPPRIYALYQRATGGTTYYVPEPKEEER